MQPVSRLQACRSCPTLPLHGGITTSDNRDTRARARQRRRAVPAASAADNLATGHRARDALGLGSRQQRYLPQSVPHLLGRARNRRGAGQPLPHQHVLPESLRVRLRGHVAHRQSPAVPGDPGILRPDPHLQRLAVAGHGNRRYRHVRALPVAGRLARRGAGGRNPVRRQPDPLRPLQTAAVLQRRTAAMVSRGDAGVAGELRALAAWDRSERETG